MANTLGFLLLVFSPPGQWSESQEMETASRSVKSSGVPTVVPHAVPVHFVGCLEA